MRIYVKRSDGVYVIFDGVTYAAITEMYAAQGMTCDFVSEAEFLANTQG